VIFRASQEPAVALFFVPGRKEREKRKDTKPRIDVQAQSKGSNQQNTTNFT
jgi:hypothetical protein